MILYSVALSSLGYHLCCVALCSSLGYDLIFRRPLFPWISLIFRRLPLDIAYIPSSSLPLDITYIPSPSLRPRYPSCRVGVLASSLPPGYYLIVSLSSVLSPKVSYIPSPSFKPTVRARSEIITTSLPAAGALYSVLPVAAPKLPGVAGHLCLCPGDARGHVYSHPTRMISISFDRSDH
jgi:hypothetical protein